MSKYTTMLKNVIDSYTGSINGINNKIESYRPYLFDFDYSLFDDSHKKELETKIIKHFYTREIGLETYGLFKLKFETKFLEILPEINDLYKSNSYEYNPLINSKMNENYTHDSSRATSSNDINTSTTNEDVTQYDTPSSLLDENYEKYATSKNKGNNENKSNSNNTSSDKFNETNNRNYEGTTGSQAQLILDYRNAIINVDMIVIDYLEELFMQVW